MRSANVHSSAASANVPGQIDEILHIGLVCVLADLLPRLTERDTLVDGDSVVVASGRLRAAATGKTRWTQESQWNSHGADDHTRSVFQTAGGGSQPAKAIAAYPVFRR
eukprot:gnl/TRDRNA2_/TRDRNA2_171667_c0_seq3.p1 gnl/TRDRNA2_/TRDRNA2_171667_c0~~gnl/TRDRNA2_/TRDRNA2_171667_c0_seq3.p1  ORF type:complete len:108 (-),score=1.52 gnl/TRDRNA2_/TRDRNA2_171667_c0_seq3:75-398(-)